jgi:glycosyltransferase involved in cell wall biosynthesis
MHCYILYLIGQLGSGGSERQLHYLLQTMDRERYRPAVVVWNFCESDIYISRIRALGVPLYTFPPTFSAITKLRMFCKLVRQLTPAVIHSYSFYTNFAAYWAARGTQSVAIGSIRGDFNSNKRESGPLLGRLSARWPRDHICNSSLAAKTAQSSPGPFSPKKLFVVRNSLDLERFPCISLPVRDRVRIVGVGSLLSIKRWDRLVVASQELRRRGYDFLVQIAGDGPLRRALEQQAQDVGQDCIKFIGYVDDIPQLLADATFLVHTSDVEGYPNVVMEAMACGRAVVAMDSGDIPALIEDGKTGFVVHRGDTLTLVERMAMLITDRDLCCRMGQAGRAKAEREFRLDRLVFETFAAYREAGWRS